MLSRLPFELQNEVVCYFPLCHILQLIETNDEWKRFSENSLFWKMLYSNKVGGSREDPREGVYEYLLRLETSLFEAVRNQEIETVKQLLQNVSPNIQDTKSVTPLLYATKGQSSKIVKLLLENGSDPNMTDSYGTSPLMKMCNYSGLSGLPSCVTTKERFDTVTYLLEAGANPNLQTHLGPYPDNPLSNYGKTALMMASTNGLSDIVSLLLQKGANVHLTTHKGWTTLIFAYSGARYYDNSDVITRLLDAGADPAVKPTFGPHQHKLETFINNYHDKL